MTEDFQKKDEETVKDYINKVLEAEGVDTALFKAANGDSMADQVLDLIDECAKIPEGKRKEVVTKGHEKILNNGKRNIAQKKRNPAP